MYVRSLLFEQGFIEARVNFLVFELIADYKT